MLTAMGLATAVTGRALDPSGTIADFRFPGFFHNAATLTPGLEAASAGFTADRFGNPNQALLTTGSGLVGSRTADFLKNRRTWTWAAWVRPDDLSEAEPGNLYSEGNNGLSGHVSIFQGRILVQLWNEAISGNWRSLSSDPVLSIGTWSHVAVTFSAPDGTDFGTCTIFKDGQPLVAGQMPYLRATGVRGTQHQFGIGMNIGYFVGSQTFAPYAFKGAIDDMRIFNRALDHAEVGELQAVDDRLAIAPALELSFQTQPDHTYRLQWSNDLKIWNDQGEIVVGNGAEFTTFISLRGRESRYWRLNPLD